MEATCPECSESYLVSSKVHDAVFQAMRHVMLHVGSLACSRTFYTRATKPGTSLIFGYDASAAKR